MSSEREKEDVHPASRRDDDKEEITRACERPMKPVYSRYHGCCKKLLN